MLAIRIRIKKFLTLSVYIRTTIKNVKKRSHNQMFVAATHHTIEL